VRDGFLVVLGVLLAVGGVALAVAAEPAFF
jgi:hypothetical protein